MFEGRVSADSSQDIVGINCTIRIIWLLHDFCQGFSKPHIHAKTIEHSYQCAVYGKKHSLWTTNPVGFSSMA